MKKFLLPVVLLSALLPALSGCGKYDYSAHISEAKTDLFLAETEEFSVSLSCVRREKPYVADGIPCPMSTVAEIVLSDCTNPDAAEYSVYVTGGGKEWGGVMSFRNSRGDYFYSQSVNAFPEGSVSLRIEWGEETREITATSVKNSDTITADQAIDYAVNAEKETIANMTQNGAFGGEFYVRLLRRDKNYYYVGIIDTSGKTVSLLLDGESGEVLARRAPE